MYFYTYLRYVQREMRFKYAEGVIKMREKKMLKVKVLGIVGSPRKGGNI